MNSEAPPHRLSIIGYWASGDEPPEQSRGLPDPHDLVAPWSEAELQACISHLRAGKVFREFMGMSSCRICEVMLGSKELTDGVWAWPEGLEHYVQAHHVKLPARFVENPSSPPSWLRSLRAELWIEDSPGCVRPIEAGRAPACVLDDTEWLEWSAQNTPSRPHADAVSLEEARALCQRLSHAAWTARIDEVMGRWRIQSAERLIYLQRCSAAVLERHLLSLRLPDPASIIDPDRANTIAEEYDGPWGAARVVMGSAEAWLVWVKGRDGEWPTEEELDKIAADRPHRLGGAILHIPQRSKSMAIPAVDETSWRYFLGYERAAGSKERQPSAAEALGKALGVNTVVVGGMPAQGNDVKENEGKTPPPMESSEGGNWGRYVLPLLLIPPALILIRKLSSLDLREVTVGNLIPLLAVVGVLGLVYWVVFGRHRDKRE